MHDLVDPREERRFVYRVARRIVGDADADDVTQDALLLAHRHRDAFRGEARYRTWLYRIATTTALGHLRRLRRSRAAGVDAGRAAAALELVPDPASSPETLVLDAETRASLVRALVELPPSYRAILLARTEAGESEVARHLGISVGNVKVRTHRARRRLRAAFEHLAGDEPLRSAA
ncbi:MAG: sigma-70 family RNA polymerase sigma factor [Deltaproteobacteria bacterium]|nr:sigma-70 family RNA polymerase sigma factor [Deltaproteobacteria bacterium]